MFKIAATSGRLRARTIIVISKLDIALNSKVNQGYTFNAISV